MRVLRVPEPFPGADSCGSKAIAPTVKFADGGPAFPQPMVDNQGRVDSAWSYGEGGMTLRDYFAGKALESLVGKITFDQPIEDLLLTKGIKIGEF